MQLSEEGGPAEMEIVLLVLEIAGLNSYIVAEDFEGKDAKHMLQGIVEYDGFPVLWRSHLYWPLLIISSTFFFLSINIVNTNRYNE